MSNAAEITKILEAYEKTLVVSELNLGPAAETQNMVPTTNTATVVKLSDDKSDKKTTGAENSENCETCDDMQHSDTDTDSESDMAKNELYKLHKASKELYSLISSGENLEPWVFSKITVAASYIEGVKNYLEYNKFKQGGEFGGEQDSHELRVVSRIRDMLHGESKEVLESVIRQVIFNLEALKTIQETSK
jgi:hypothetical protein